MLITMDDKPLSGSVCIVTGATRGIGKGVALQLAEKGGKVYITGRTLDPRKDSKVGGSLRETAEEISARGGICVPVVCDHSKDGDVERLFEQVGSENDGRLDILVNNAYSAVNAMIEQEGKSFWEISPDFWDTVNNAGLRNHYICSVYAARLMVPRKKGLIVNVSSVAGLTYVMTPAFGIGKGACDRMATDCGIELRKHNVAFVSLWPGIVRTETVLQAFSDGDLLNRSSMPKEQLDAMKKITETAETTEFSGKCIVAMATDPDIMKMSGKIVLTCDLAKRYNLQDKEGHHPNEITQVKFLLAHCGLTWLANFVPGFIRLPKWMLALGGNKFH
ncbi:Dehydrogenase reductase SDR member [Mactra antiquata]